MATKTTYTPEQQKAIDNLTAASGGKLTSSQKKAIANTKTALESSYPNNSANKLSPVSSLSTEQGVKALNEVQKTETRLSGTPAVNTGTSGATPVATSKVTLINPETEQSVSFDNADGSRKAIEKYLKSGYALSEASGNIPSWLAPETPQTKLANENSKLAQAKAEYENLANQLKNLNVDNDPVLQGQISGISAKFDARIQQMERIGDSRVAALTQTGIRTGSRYTGGAGGVFGSIISEEEVQGVQRIAGLEADKQEAIQAAKTAFATQKFAQYSKMVELAEKKYDMQLDAIKELNRAQEAQDKLLQDANQEITKSINSILTDAAKNGAPADIRAAISGAGSLSEAVAAAGDYLQSGAGIVGEYQFYKRQASLLGQTAMSFDEYQTVDANRKAKATVNGLPQNISTQVDKLSAAFDSSPIVKQYNEVQNKKMGIDSILASGVAGPGDLAIVFEFMKALDPTSVVREQEYSNAAASGNIFMGAMAKFNGYLKEGGGFLPENVKKDFQTIVNNKLKVATTQYENLRKETARKIEMKTSQFEDTPGSDYLTDYGGATTTQQLLDKQTSADNKVIEIGQGDPKKQEQINSFLDDFPEATSLDVLEFLGVPFSSVGGDTKQASNRPTRNNNPLNIKMSSATKAYPGVTGSDPSPATDGGKFLTFATPQDGFNAAKTLIKTSGYINLTVDAAMKRWSNSGYGGEILPAIKGKTIKQLTAAELDALIKAMAKREGYQGNYA